MAVDWFQVRNDYINGSVTYRELSKKYNVSVCSIAKHAKAEKWQERKTEQLNRIQREVEQKTADIIVRQEVDRQKRALQLSDELLDKLEQAIHELDQYTVERKQKVRNLRYGKGGKVVEENVTERVDLASVTSSIDRKGLQQVAMALKAIRDVQSGADDETDNDVHVVFRGGEDFAE